VLGNNPANRVRLAWKKGSYVPIWAHAKKYQIKTRQGAFDVSKLGL
jgi:hypothetical protein